MKDRYQKATALALALALVATALSLYAALTVYKKMSGSGMDDQIRAGINAYVAEQTGQAAPAAPSEGQRVAAQVADNPEDDDPVKGDKNAPVSMVEFSDYQCPYCARFFADTLGALEGTYFSTGKAKLVYRDFPLNFHPGAAPAAVAAECARKQGGDDRYFEFHDLIFQNQSSLTADTFKSHAASLGLNMGAFTACVDGGEFDEEVAKDFSDGQAAGVTGTPGFLILMEKKRGQEEALKALELVQRGQYVIQYIETENGDRHGLRVSGAHPYSTFEKIIEIGL